jgi:hypothetical protein
MGILKAVDVDTIDVDALHIYKYPSCDFHRRDELVRKSNPQEHKSYFYRKEILNKILKIKLFLFLHSRFG